VAELADALDSGSSARKGVRVQIPASAPSPWCRSYQGILPFTGRPSSHLTPRTTGSSTGLGSILM